MSYVPPDGDVPARFVICGEAPAREEVRLGRGFVGPSGRLLWPILRRMAGLTRADCYVTNLCKHPLDNDESGEAKMSPEEFERCKDELVAEIVKVVQPGSVILAVGALAAKALLEDRYTSMEACNGVSFNLLDIVNVVPCWHPAAALRGAGEGKDPLAWMGDAIAHFRRDHARYQERILVPKWKHWGDSPPPTFFPLAIDTEGTPANPECLTYATSDSRYFVPPASVPSFWDYLMVWHRHGKIIYHNAPWDWAVMEAMGCEKPWQIPYDDTMQIAYQLQTEPQGLKDLAYRHFGVRMKSWADVVMPHYDQAVIQAAQVEIVSHTTTITHSPKTGKLLKKPKVTVEGDRAKSLKRAIANPKLLAQRLGWWNGKMGSDMSGIRTPSFVDVPFDEMAEYATLDPFMTLALWRRWVG